MSDDQQNLGGLINEFLHIIWRRKWWVLGPALLGPIISILLTVYLPKKYLSTTLILVEGQKVPEEYVKSAVSGPIEGRLSTIRQQLMSRSLLQKVIDRFGLYKEEYKKMASEEVIALMQKNIEVKTVGTKNIDAFSVSFQGEDPKVVMNVTNELASLVIEENLKFREQLVEGTSEFLENELKSVKEALEVQENRIGEFKKLSMGELPQQLDANLRTLDRFQSELVSIQLAIKSTLDRKLMLEKTYEISRQKLKESDSITSPLQPHSSEGEPGLPLSQKLVDLNRRLSALQSEYKDTYPDIVMMKREIEQVEEQIRLASVDVKNPLREEPVSGSQVPPSRILTSRSREMELTYLEDLKRQIREIIFELGALKERESEIQRQRRIYSERVERTPSREQELAILVRDYENTKKNYESLLDKKLSAKISENLEKRQKGEQFRVLDAANLPEKPFKPNRFMILVGGILGGIGSGIGLAFLLEQLDHSVREPKLLEQAISVPVLATIPDYTAELKSLKLAHGGESSNLSERKPDKANG